MHVYTCLRWTVLVSEILALLGEGHTRYLGSHASYNCPIYIHIGTLLHDLFLPDPLYMPPPPVIFVSKHLFSDSYYYAPYTLMR